MCDAVYHLGQGLLEAEKRTSQVQGRLLATEAKLMEERLQAEVGKGECKAGGKADGLHKLFGRRLSLG